MILLRNLVVLLILVGLTITFSSSVRSQDSPICFMRDGNGRVIDLSRLCSRRPANVVIQDVGQTEESLGGEQQADARLLAYVEAYCSARGKGSTHNSAVNQGIGAMQDMSSLPNDDVLPIAQLLSQKMCP
jgi:hypothetical protein